MPAFQQGQESGSSAGRITGSLLPFLFSFGRLQFGEPVFWGEVILSIHPNAGEEIIKSANAGGIAEREAAEDGIKGSFPEHAGPDSDGSHLQFQGKQIGTQHTGRKPGLRSKNRVAVPHNEIGL